jgi:hypothetical protein
MTTRKVTKKMSMPREKPATRNELQGFRSEVRRDFKKNDERWNKNDEQWKKSDERFAANNQQLRRDFEANNQQLRRDFEAIAAGLRHDFEAITPVLRQDFEAIAARLLKAQQESFRSQFGALDDKYRDIPERVATLEDRVGITR